MRARWLKQLGTKKSGLMHHAFLLRGSQRATVDYLFDYLATEHGMPIQGNPDVWRGSFESFGIDEGRALKALHMTRAVTGDKRVFIVEVERFTSEAQNALLKMFEEPTSHSHFFILMRSVETLLPTLRSRLMEVEVDDANHDTSGIAAREFLAAPVATRQSMLKDLIETKNIGGAVAFLDELLAVLHDDMTADTTLASTMQDVLEVRTFLLGRSPSIKMLLEHVALTVPAAGNVRSV
jgi:hypothetical protein